jgi:Tetracyclin repressor-like, C-terminal domain
VTKAMLAAMSTTEEATVPLKHEIDSTLRAIIADVVDGDGHCSAFADLDGIVRVLGSVWFAELTYWSNGVNPSSSMGDNLASAAELLLG